MRPNNYDEMPITDYDMRLQRHPVKPVLSHSAAMFPMFAKTVLAGLLCSTFSTSFAQAPSAIQGSTVLEPQDPLKVSKTLSSSSKRKQAQAPVVDPSSLPTLIKALSISGQPEELIEMQGQVEVTRGDAKLTADRASYQQVEDRVDASGNIQLTRGEDCYTGQVLRYIMETGVGYVTKPTYFLARNNGQGKAERIDFASEERSTITNGTYSTCQGLDPDWYLKADTLNLDTGLDTGVAGKSVLYFKGVPIIATPAWLDFSFPLSGARHSGILPPIIGHSNKGGIEFGLPYYFNIAPNRDLTVRPKMIARRGLQLGLEGRYLGESYLGETAIEGLSDKLTNTTRYAINSTHTQKLTPQAVFSWNLNRASDNDYPADFSNSTTKTAQRLLLREVGLDYYGAIWNASLRSTSYQVLQDPSAPITQPYERLPQLSFHAGQNDIWGLDWSVDALATRFWHPTFIRGNRAVINPQVSFPWIKPAFFAVPKLSFHATQYQLEDPLTRQTSNYQRSIPSISLDTGVVFERATSLLGKSMIQTLEPRLFYVNTPYRDQSKLPLFDSALADFNFAQIFSENRFTGHDRIGDSNQVTAGLISRFLEEDGTERFKFALGQRFYFNTQRVSLDGKTNPSRSDILLAGNGQLSSTLSVEAALQVSQSDRQSVRSSYGIHWEPAEKKLLNLQYQFQRDVLKQFEVSGQWPLSYRWYAVGKSNYSLLNKKLVEGLAGLEYRADCWALRFVAHRFATTRLNNNSGFAIQLELTGLARLGFGSNPVETLKKSISGYRPSSENE